MPGPTFSIRSIINVGSTSWWTIILCYRIIMKNVSNSINIFFGEPLFKKATVLSWQKLLSRWAFFYSRFQATNLFIKLFIKNLFIKIVYKIQTCFCNENLWFIRKIKRDAVWCMRTSAWSISLEYFVFISTSENTCGQMIHYRTGIAHHK